jgi:hypothetical protein
MRHLPFPLGDPLLDLARLIWTWIDGLPVWLAAVLLAVVWTAAVNGIYLLAVFTFIDGWSLQEKLSLGQVATGISGFGGGFVALLFAGRALASTFGDPKIELSYAVESTPAMGPGQPTLNVYVAFYVENHSEAIPTAWQFAASVEAPGVIQPRNMDGAKLTNERRRLVSNSASPLFKGSLVPVGTAILEFSRPPDLDFGTRDSIRYSFPLQLTIHTNLGRPTTSRVEVAVDIARTPTPQPPINPRDALEDAGSGESIRTKEF